MQIDQILILCIFSDSLLDRRTFFINNTQIALIKRRRLKQDLIDKSHLLLRAEIPHPALHKMLRFLGANGNDRALREQDTERDCNISLHIMIDFYGRDIHKDQRVTVLKFDTGTLLIIESCSYVGNIYIKIIGNFLGFFHRGACHLNPDAFFKLFTFFYDLFLCFVYFQHDTTSSSDFLRSTGTYICNSIAFLFPIFNDGNLRFSHDAGNPKLSF